MRAVFLVLVTLSAWTTTASLFVILKRAPLTRGAPVTIYYPILCSLLPWLAGCVFWIKVRKRAKLGVADKDATDLCYRIITFTVAAAYGAIVSLEPLLLWVMIRRSGR
jgi:hypothetical protein